MRLSKPAKTKRGGPAAAPFPVRSRLDCYEISPFLRRMSMIPLASRLAAASSGSQIGRPVKGRLPPVAAVPPVVPPVPPVVPPAIPPLPVGPAVVEVGPPLVVDVVGPPLVVDVVGPPLVVDVVGPPVVVDVVGPPVVVVVVVVVSPAKHPWLITRLALP
jgi:hypothetical protein